jgi:hypothetical protein
MTACADTDPAIPATPDPRPEVVRIDALGSPVDPAIAIDTEGAARVAYGRLTDGDLVYATNAAGGWTVQVVESEGTTGIRPAITVSADGTVTIVYGALDVAELRSARKGGAGGWIIETLGPTDVWGNEPALATAPDGAAHVCFRDTGDQSLRYGRSDGAGWVLETIGEDGDGCSVAVDAGGAVHLAWGEVQYATNASGAWQVETVNGDWVWDRLQLVLGPDGAPHVAYFEFWSELVRVATRGADGTWSLRSRDGGRSFLYALDSAGRSHLSYVGPDTRGFPLVYEAETDLGVVAGDVDADVISPAMAIGPDDRAQAAWTADFELRWARLTVPDGVDQDCDGLRW